MTNAFAKRRRSWLYGGVAAAILLGAATAASAQTTHDQRTHEFNIPAESLGQALKDFGATSNTQILFDPVLVSGLASPALKGRHSDGEALDLLLQATQLTWHTTDAGVVLIQAAAPAAASEAATDEPATTVIVVGTRATQRSAIQQKRRNSGVTEVLKAEDIGQLPERNIADALQRLAGVGGNNDKGRSNSINLRGLGGGYTLTQVNGRQVASAFGSRSVDLDIYPSETVGRAVVYKTPTADQTDGGVGGAVDISTFRPLDLGNYGAVSLQSIYSPTSKHEIGENGLGSRQSFIISHVFDGRKLGLLFGATSLRETIMGERFTPGTWDSGDFDGDGVGGDFGYGVHDQDGKAVAAPLYISEEPSVDNNRRDSLYGALQWKPSDTFSLTLDALYSKVSTDGVSPFLNYNFYCDGSISGTSQPNVGATSFHSDSVCIDVYSGAQKSRDATYNLGANFDWKVGGWDLQTDLAYSQAPRTYSFPFAQASGFYSTDVDVDFTRGDDIPRITVNDLDLTDTSGQYVTSMQLAANETSLETLTSANFDAARPIAVGWLTKMSFGLRYAKREKAYTINNADLVPPAGGVAVSSLPHAFPFRNLYDGFKTDVPSSWVYFDVWKAIDAYGPQAANEQDVVDYGQSFDLNEATLAGYARFDYEGALAGKPLHGNFGVRVVSTDLTSRGASVDYTVDPVSGEVVASSAALTPINIKNSYTNVLPSATATMDLSDTLLLRGAAAITIIRPEFFDLRASTYINVGPVGLGSPVVGSRGNPLLEPVQSRQADLAVEWYPSTGTYFAVAAFYKNFDSFYLQGSTNINPNGQQAVYLVQPIQDKNAGGEVAGLEISGSYELDFLPGPFSNITIYGNATQINIPLETDYNASPTLVSNALPFGMMRSMFNIGAYYDDKKLTMSVNYYGQGETVIKDGGKNFLRLPFQLLSASVGYHLTPKVTLTLSGNNLLDARQNYGDIGLTVAGANTDRLSRSTIVGRSFFGGIRYQF